MLSCKFELMCKAAKPSKSIHFAVFADYFARTKLLQPHTYTEAQVRIEVACS